MANSSPLTSDVVNYLVYRYLQESGEGLHYSSARGSKRRWGDWDAHRTSYGSSAGRRAGLLLGVGGPPRREAPRRGRLGWCGTGVLCQHTA